MTITSQQLIALLPLFIVGLAVVLVILSIAWKRNHFLNATLTALGLAAAMISLYFANQAGAVSVTSLIRVDFYGLFYSALILFSGLATCLFAYPWLKNFTDNKDEFYLLLLMACLGGLLLAISNHFASLFLGVELLSLPVFGMVGYAFGREHALEASLKYTVLSAVASSFLLFGIALIYANTGDLSFAGFGRSFSSEAFYSPLLLIGFGMMMVGLGFKLSLAPFHLWTPDVYQGAHASVSAFLATASKVAIFCALVRLVFYIPAGQGSDVQLLLAVMAFISIVFGNLMALNQQSVKRLLGYSSIGHFGYLLVAVVALKASAFSLETIGVYLAGYVATNLAAFGVVSVLSTQKAGAEIDSLDEYRGIFWRSPFIATLMTLMMVSFAGIPLTLGFIGKFYVIASAVDAHLWCLTGAIVLGSALGLYYYLRVVITMYLKEAPQSEVQLSSLWFCKPDGLMVVFSTAFVMILGVWPQPLINIARGTIHLLH